MRRAARAVVAISGAMTLGLSARSVSAQIVVAKIDGTSRPGFTIGATGAAPLSLVNDAGRLTLSNGLRVSGGSIDFSGATIDSPLSLTGGSLDDCIIGGTTPAAGTFTTLICTGGALNGTIGGTSPAAGAFTTLSSSGQYTNTVTTGSSPFVVSSTTLVENLNADRVDGLNLSGVTHAGSPVKLSASGQMVTIPPPDISDGFALVVVSGDTNQMVLETPGVADMILVSFGSPAGYQSRFVTGDLSLSGGVWSIGAGKVVETMLAANAVTSAKIVDGTIAEADLGALCVTSGKIAALNVGAGHLASNSVTTAKILNGNVTTEKLAASAVTANELASDAVTTAKILNGNVTTAKLASSAVTANELASDAVTTAKILNANVTGAKVSDTLNAAISYGDASAGTEGEFGANVIRVGVQVRDARGNAISGHHLVTWGLLAAGDDAPVWGGTPSSISYVAGSQWATSDFGKKQIAMTSSTGQLTLDITITGDNTLYFAAAVGGKMYIVTLDYD